MMKLNYVCHEMIFSILIIIKFMITIITIDDFTHIELY